MIKPAERIEQPKRIIFKPNPFLITRQMIWLPKKIDDRNRMHWHFDREQMHKKHFHHLLVNQCPPQIYQDAKKTNALVWKSIPWNRIAFTKLASWSKDPAIHSKATIFFASPFCDFILTFKTMQIVKYRHSSISAVSISAIFDLTLFVILSYFSPL